jgi:hypothetical protein
MPTMVRYNSNHSPDGNRICGPSEVIVEYPEAKQSCTDIYEYAENALNENTYLVTELLQSICSEGYPEIDVIELDQERNFIICAEEVIYSGCRDIDFRSELKVRLSRRFEKDGIYFFLSENAVLCFRHWLKGDGPEEEEEEP